MGKLEIKTNELMNHGCVHPRMHMREGLIFLDEKKCHTMNSINIGALATEQQKCVVDRFQK
jgi:hypothetical protein